MLFYHKEKIDMNDPYCSMEIQRYKDEVEYYRGYEVDLAAINKVLDDINAPHDSEESVSLDIKRIRLLGEQRDNLQNDLNAVNSKLQEANTQVGLLKENVKLLLQSLKKLLSDHQTYCHHGTFPSAEEAEDLINIIENNNKESLQWTK